MSPVAAPRHRAPARFKLYFSPETGHLIFIIDSFTETVVAGPFNRPDIAMQWARNHA